MKSLVALKLYIVCLTIFLPSANFQVKDDSSATKRMKIQRTGKVMDYKHVMVFITVDSPEAAQKITDVILNERKAACVNILSGVESYYWWEGKREKTTELLLTVKTRAKLLDELVMLVKECHPYSIPEIITLPIISGNEGYLRWIEGETR